VIVPKNEPVSPVDAFTNARTTTLDSDGGGLTNNIFVEEIL